MRNCLLGVMYLGVYVSFCADVVFSSVTLSFRVLVLGGFFFIENNDKYTQVTGLLPHPFLNNHTFFAVAKVLRLCIGKTAGLRM